MCANQVFTFFANGGKTAALRIPVNLENLAFRLAALLAVNGVTKLL